MQVFYDSSSLDYVMDYFSGMDEATWNIRVAVCCDGLRTRVGDYDVGELAERLVEQSMDGLSRQSRCLCLSRTIAEQS